MYPDHQWCQMFSSASCAGSWLLLPLHYHYTLHWFFLYRIFFKYHITTTRIIIWRSFPLQLSPIYIRLRCDVFAACRRGAQGLHLSLVSPFYVFGIIRFLKLNTRLYIPYRHHHRPFQFQVWTLMLTCQPAFLYTNIFMHVMLTTLRKC